MKGFPNQVAELTKIATGIGVLAELVDAGENARDDGVFGPALVRAGVAGTGHAPRPVEDYIRQQLALPAGNQSFRTTARGLRQLYRLMDLIDDAGATVEITPTGRQAASFAGAAFDRAQVEFWRRVIRNLTHEDPRGSSHPYQVLLRLVARVPGVTRAKCALALEARNDSAEELDRVVALAGLDEAAIIASIGVSRANWDNAKKVLPRFAEQLEDVVRAGQTYVIADAPGRADAGPAHAPAAPVRAPGVGRPRATGGIRAPRTSREVTPNTIGVAGTGEESDEVQIAPELDPAAAAAAITLRARRLRRHNLLVRELALRLAACGARLLEDPFDILAVVEASGLLVEVKSLDGSAEDERERVRDALSQLLYYEVFVVPPVAADAQIQKVACFESRISRDHSAFLNGHGIAVIWPDGEGFAGDQLAVDTLRRYLNELE